MYPVLPMEVAREQHQDRLREAEIRRLVRKKRQSRNILSRLVLLGAQLLAQASAPSESTPTMPAT